jgi:hypothetical protein
MMMVRFQTSGLGQRRFWSDVQIVGTADVTNAMRLLEKAAFGERGY